MDDSRRAASPVVGIILMVAVVFVIAASIWAAGAGLTEDLREPAPNVAETTGEFEAGSDDDEQNVQITHVAGDDIDINDIEIILEVQGPDDDFPEELRLVDLPGEHNGGADLADDNIEGNDDIIAQDDGVFGESGFNQIIVDRDSNTWEAGDTIQFRIRVGGADFRDPVVGSNPEADELEVTIIHTPSNAILFENEFSP